MHYPIPGCTKTYDRQYIMAAEGTVFAYEVLENIEAVRRGGQRRIRYSPTAMVARERIINESDHENGQRPGSTRPRQHKAGEIE